MSYVEWTTHRACRKLGRRLARLHLETRPAFAGMVILLPNGSKIDMVGGLRIDGLPLLEEADKKSARLLVKVWDRLGGFAAKYILAAFKDEQRRLILKAAKKIGIKKRRVADDVWLRARGEKRTGYFLHGKEMPWEEVAKLVQKS